MLLLGIACKQSLLSLTRICLNSHFFLWARKSHIRQSEVR